MSIPVSMWVAYDCLARMIEGGPESLLTELGWVDSAEGRWLVSYRRGAPAKPHLY